MMRGTVAIIVFLCGVARGSDSWILQNDWSESGNPSYLAAPRGGSWTCMGGGTAGPYLYDRHLIGYSPGDFSSDQPAWVQTGGALHLGLGKMIHNGNENVPATGWINKGHDYRSGDVLGHAPWHVRWTAPRAMNIRVSGSVWKIRTGYGAVTQVWLLEKGAWGNNTAEQRHFLGSLEGPPIHFRNNPLTFDLVISVATGQTVHLYAGDNDYAALSMTVSELPVVSPTREYYVAPDGNDMNNGAKATPFATIGHAQQAVRQQILLGMTGDITVYLRGGIHYLDETLVFGAQDSGTGNYRIIYTAYPGENPIVSGGQPITNWTAVGSDLWEAQLPEVAAGSWWFRQLWAGDRRCQRSRWPDGVQPTNPTEAWSFGTGGGPAVTAANAVFVRMNDRQQDWLAADLHHPLPQPAWSPGTVPGLAKSVNDMPSGMDVRRGDVFGHACYVVRWTSPIATRIRVSGNVWRMRNSDWLDVWLLEKGDWNNNSIAQRHHVGTIPFFAYPRSTPLAIANTEFDVVSGQTVHLVVAGNDYAGVNFTVEDLNSHTLWDLKSQMKDVYDSWLLVSNVSGDYKTITLDRPLTGTDVQACRTELVMMNAWATARARVATMSSPDVVTDTVCGLIGHVGGALGPAVGRRCFLEHNPAYIDQPWEWYLDRTTGILRLLMPAGQNPGNELIVAPRLRQLVVLRGMKSNPVKNIVFRGVSFEHTGWDLPAQGYAGLQAGVNLTPGNGENAYVIPLAMQLTYAQACHFENCRFAHLAQTALGLAQGAKANNVVSCEFRDIGGSGIMTGFRGGDDANGIIFGGAGNAISDWSDPTDAPADNLIQNNYLHDCGAEWFDSVGMVDQFTARTIFEKNTISDLPYTAISTGFRWDSAVTSQKGVVVRNNHIMSCMGLLDDGGGIYTLGNHQSGVIQGNVVHGVRDNVGLYNDQGSSYLTIADNVIYDCKDTYLWHCNQCVENTFTWGTNYWNDDYGSPGQPSWIVEAAGVEPNLPQLNLSLADCNTIVATGVCAPWAKINSAMISETAQDISGYLTVLGNGFIRGTLPKALLQGDMATVELTVSDPEGDLSAAGQSNALNLQPSGDINQDGMVDLGDVAVLAQNWLENACITPQWCQGADTQCDGHVNLADLEVVARHWLQGIP